MSSLAAACHSYQITYQMNVIGYAEYEPLLNEGLMMLTIQNHHNFYIKTSKSTKRNSRLGAQKQNKWQSKSNANNTKALDSKPINTYVQSYFRSLMKGNNVSIKARYRNPTVELQGLSENQTLWMQCVQSQKNPDQFVILKDLQGVIHLHKIKLLL